MRLGVAWTFLALVLGCGARSALEDKEFDGAVPPEGGPEACNGIDDDYDRSVDEDFRDETGRYVHVDHCGRCDSPCRTPDVPRSRSVECGLVEESPVCVATDCDDGYTPSFTGQCTPIYERLCLSCADDGDCGDFEGATCADLGGERRCSISCELRCPDGYMCNSDGDCEPTGGGCYCDPGETFTLACALHDPKGERCAGSARCDDGELSECAAPAEVCDEVDNDCNGFVDDGFRDGRGAYILDIHNCGECGVDCTESTIPEGDLVCGGDPFAPTCVLLCPDTIDGIMPGDRVDADRDIATGCECTVTALDDRPGPVLASGEDLDVNCDGADGIVVESFYVATDGDDGGPGSPTRPLGSISEATRRASESIGTDMPRPHVFIASGSYAETVTVPDGVSVHGGYRRDFLSLDPNGFRVEIRAPTTTAAPGGAALVIEDAGRTETVVEWISVRGADAAGASAAAFGAYLRDPGSRLVLRDLELRSGVGGAGAPGPHGAAGRGPTGDARAGDPPRGAIENASHECVSMPSNVVSGGPAGRNSCDGLDVSGGDGGSADCPVFAEVQGSGSAGRTGGSGVPGGAGGMGGMDSQGPIMGISCPRDVCCGLADFTVPTEFMGPQSGGAGSDGASGRAGAACDDALGAFDGDRWIGDVATAGTPGGAASGAGGGGAGGGAVMDWFVRECEFADGLGGGGGGGGAGGCGGVGGMPGTSGGPAVALLVRYTRTPTAFPTIERVTLAPSDGGRGGDGGAGGDGGLGGNGAFGGELARALRSTPTLAGPFPGGRGGKGGNGGAGGGAGGGCGGGSIGVWMTGIGTTEPGAVAGWRAANTFRLGRGGVAGRGGGGAAAAPPGVAGGARDVVVR